MNNISNILIYNITLLMFINNILIKYFIYFQKVFYFHNNILNH